jgi:hypothetical protein
MICGGAIDEYLPRTHKYCSDRKCKWKYFEYLRQQAQDYRESQKRKREILNQHVRNLRNNQADAAGIEIPEDFIPVAIPVNMRHITNLPEKRRGMFCDRLKQLSDQAAAQPPSFINLTDDSTMQTKCDDRMQGKQLHSILNNVCTVCRGSCCMHGEDHAYLKVDNLLRYMHEHLELQQQQVFDKYVSCLTKKTYKDSCLYHTETGCALPSYMRSESCSSFACDGLVEIEKHVIDTKSTRFFIAAMEGEKVLRSAFIDGNQIRVYHMYFADE